MKDKTVERIIKIPRTRISDCSRLIFRLGEEPVWRDIDSDPDLFPIYPMPPMKRGVYSLYGAEIIISPGSTINDITRAVCGSLLLTQYHNSFLHTLIFKNTGELEIQTETI